MNLRPAGRLGMCLSVGACVCLSLLITSCVSLEPDGGQSTTTTLKNDPDAVAAAQAAVDALAGVQPGGIPDHFRPEEPAEITRTEGDFDVNAYFGVLEHLSMEPGYVLDYLYVYDGMGGYPFIYARPSDSLPYASRDEYVASVTEEGQAPDENRAYSEDFLEHIVVDDTREGYFQLVALRIMAKQFYLYWHAGYNDTRLVCDEESLERTLSSADSAFEGGGLPSSVARKARKIDLEPTVEFLDDSTALVRVVTFTMWGGFAEVRYTISRQFPHTVSSEAETLVEYDCGVSF